MGVLRVGGFRSCAFPSFLVGTAGTALGFAFALLAVRSNLPRWSERALDAVVLLRSEEHTSELQSQSNLVCRLLLEKKKQMTPPRSHCRARTDRIHTVACV